MLESLLESFFRAFKGALALALKFDFLRFFLNSFFMIKEITEKRISQICLKREESSDIQINKFMNPISINPGWCTIYSWSIIIPQIESSFE